MEAQELFAELGLPAPQPFDPVPGAWSALVRADASLDAWQRLWQRWPQTGWAPLLIVADPAEDHYSFESEAAQAEHLDPQAVLIDLNQRIPRNIRDGSGEPPEPVERPSIVPGSGELLLLVAQTPKPWLWPAMLGHLGPVNLGIDAAEVSAVLGRWHAAFGVVPVYLGEADLEVLVPNPPTDQRVAMLVAAEHGMLAPDEVEPTTLVERTAIVRSHRWSFWWD